MFSYSNANRNGLFAVIVVFLLVSCNGGGGNSGEKSATASSTVLSSSGASACEAIGWKVANGEACHLPDDPTATSLVRLRAFSGDGETFSWCTGTVIDPYVVLTAAHCLEQATSVAIDTPAGTYYGVETVAHPGYTIGDNGTGGVLFNDLALILSNDPIDVVPASILLSRPPQAGERAIVAGFGITEPEGEAGTINAGNASVRNVTANHVFISYADDESHPCPGDSGGPLLLNQNGWWVIAGVVSQSDPTVAPENVCRPGDVTLYTNTQNPSVFDFIQAYVPNVSVR